MPRSQGWGFLSISRPLYCGSQTLGGLRQRFPAFPPITAEMLLGSSRSFTSTTGLARMDLWLCPQVRGFPPPSQKQTVLLLFLHQKQ